MLVSKCRNVALVSSKSLTRRAQLVCDTPDSLRDENRYLERVFHKNNYNADFIRPNIYSPTEADATNRNPTDPIALQRSCSPQTYNYVTTPAD